MASLAPEDKIKFLLAILETVGDFKPNYGDVASQLGINTAQNAQRRFKAIVEAEKTHVLQSAAGATKVVGVNTAAAPATPAPTTQTSSATAKAAKSTKAKRKRTDNDDDNYSDGGKVKGKAKEKQVKKGAVNKTTNEKDNHDEGAAGGAAVVVVGTANEEI